jgi:glycosyltransferase involved in cell wall biosynthesis
MTIDKVPAEVRDARPAALPVIGFVVPCFNEEAVLPHSLPALLAQLTGLAETRQISPDSYVLFVDDGSVDRTWDLIVAACRANPGRVRGLKLSHNAGHQNALLAGLIGQIGKCDATISIDADLQDDIAAVAPMVDHFRAGGADIVFGVRRGRATDTFLKRGTADLYYRLLDTLGAKVIPHHADFRLMSDRAMRALAGYGEVNLFLRGIVLQLGFKTATVEFDRLARLHGETKYTLTKMLRLASDGVTSLSIRPIRIVAAFGVLLFLAFIGMAFWVFGTWLAGDTVQGWTSVMLLFLLISSFQTLAMAVIGEYVGKTYYEAKARPRYIIEEDIG